MFRSLRWRLTVWFVLLSALIYIALTSLAGVIFYGGLTSALDEELHALSAELRPSVNLNGPAPTLAQWAAKIGSHRLLATVQLYKPDGTLLESYGPPGINQLSLNERERQTGSVSVRVRCRPLQDGPQVIGYLQAELATQSRDDAVSQFALTMALLFPLLVLALGAAGYFIAGKAAEPVEKSFRVLRQFMSDAGHELGTPLSIIQTNLEAMNVELAEKSVESPKSEVIERAGKRMESLLRDLSLLAKLESPKAMGPHLPLRLDQITSATAEEFSELFKAKGIAFQCQELPNITINGDQEALKRLLSNLLQNALRYTDAGGTVSVTLEAQGRWGRLSVSDTGVGIPPDKLPHVFDRFYRVDESRTRAAGGAGLGLSIVKATAEAHAGRVEVESVAGKGSRFSVILPYQTMSATLHTFFTRQD